MFPVLLDFGRFKLPTYGFFVALGYLAAILWLKRRREAMGLSEDRFWSLIYWIFGGAVLGGKLMFVAVEFRRFAGGEFHFLADFRYGFVFFGGFFGACLAALWCQRRVLQPFWPASDYFGVALPVGHAIGRLGCLAAGCCYGRPTALPWGLKPGASPLSSTPPELWGVPLHPTQLYESAGNLAIAALLGRLALPAAARGRLVPGTVFLAYVALYSCLRFGVEFLRGDERGFWRGLSVSQWASLACLVGAAALLARRGVRKAG